LGDSRLVEEVQPKSYAAYDHRQVLWSPDSRRLAVFTTIGQRARISVFEEDSLRTVYTNDQTELPVAGLPMIWSEDGTSLFAAPFLGLQRGAIVRIPVGDGNPDTIFSGPGVHSSDGAEAGIRHPGIQRRSFYLLREGAKARELFTTQRIPAQSLGLLIARCSPLADSG